MPVRFLCPECHQLLGVASRKIGAEVNCPNCRALIIVPDPNEPSPATEAGTFDQSDMEEVLTNVVAYTRPAPVEKPPVRSASHMAADTDHAPADHSTLTISRRMVYVQGILLAMVAALAFLAGLWIGGGK